jgi:hypothetical protein
MIMERKGPTPPNPSRRLLPSGRQGGLYSGGRYGYLKDFRREEAEKRQSARDARSPEQQLALLDSKLGDGKGAKKERARLQAIIDGEKSG